MKIEKRALVFPDDPGRRSTFTGTAECYRKFAKRMLAVTGKAWPEWDSATPPTPALDLARRKLRILDL